MKKELEAESLEGLLISLILVRVQRSGLASWPCGVKELFIFVRLDKVQNIPMHWE